MTAAQILDDILQREREPLLAAQIELADITDEAGLCLQQLRDGMDRSLAVQVLARIYGRLTRLNDDFFSVEYQAVDARQIGLDLPAADGGHQ